MGSTSGGWLMTYPIADKEQDNDVALRAAAYSRWVELRQQRQPRDAERHDWIEAQPRDAERHDWIEALLMGEELRSLDGDVLRVDRIAQTLAPEEVERWATEHKFFEGFDRLRQGLDEIAKTDFRQA
jgi:hypothetical protein